MILIGVGGARGSGKNTFAEICSQYIHTEFGRKCYEMSWASLLKKSAAATLGFDLEEHEVAGWADSFKNEGRVLVQVMDINEEPYWDDVKVVSGREFLQNYGTEAHRDIFHSDFWVNEFWKINNFEDDAVVFITDTRFDNEAKSVKERGGINIRINREEVEESLEDAHPSEAGFDPKYLDYVIGNNEGFSELSESAETFINEVMEKHG